MEEENSSLNFIPAILAIFGLFVIGTGIMYLSQKHYQNQIQNLPEEIIPETATPYITVTIPIIYNPDSTQSATPSGGVNKVN